MLDMAFAPRERMDPPPRSSAADAYNCIMVPIRWIDRIQVCGAIDRANGELASGQHSPNAPRHDCRSSFQKARLAVHCPSACSGVKALRNTSCATAACRLAPLAFRSLDPSRALRDPDRRRRDEERPSSSEQRTASKGGSTARNAISSRRNQHCGVAEKPLTPKTPYKSTAMKE
jgi:hypothetical protein